MRFSLTLDEGFPAMVLERLVMERAVEPDLAPPGTVLPSPTSGGHISMHVQVKRLCFKHSAIRSNAAPLAPRTQCWRPYVHSYMLYVSTCVTWGHHKQLPLYRR